jgi:hypothetical protein
MGLSRAVPAVPIVLGLILVGCGSNERPRHSAAIPDRLPIAKRPQLLGAPGASVRILAPLPGQHVSPRFVVRVAVSDFDLARPRLGQRPLRGTGLLEFSLDDGRYDQPQYSGENGRWALALAVNGYYSPASNPRIVYTRIPAGTHTLTVKLANRNEAPTGVSAAVKFNVQ